MTDFFRYQVRVIRAGGLTALIRKLRVLAWLSLGWLAALAMRLVRPLILIRIAPLRSERIGHFCAGPELYLCGRDAHPPAGRTWDLFYHQPPICNQQLKRMWDRTLPVAAFAGWVDWANHRWPGYEPHVVPIVSERDLDGLLWRTKPHLAFTAEEARAGEEGLRRMGIAAGAPFVCFTSRDSAYLSSVWPEVNWRYHEYRNSSIHAYGLAAELLANRGYYAVRMGAVVQEPLRTSHPRIIDYSTNGYRSDLLDIYLGATCRFFLAGLTGLEHVPMIFRRPRIIANFIPLAWVPAWGPQDLIIPKRLWLKAERRFLTFGEIIRSSIGGFLSTEQYERLGLEPIENTPEEIASVASEMDRRLNGTWESAPEDEELQRKFWALYEPGELNRVFLARIGADFLRAHHALLEEQAVVRC